MTTIQSSEARHWLRRAMQRLAALFTSTAVALVIVILIVQDVWTLAAALALVPQRTPPSGASSLRA